MARHRNVDVLVVGAGPAGCAAAITLARAGVAATVLDRPRTDRPGSELVVPRAVQALAELGLESWLGTLPAAAWCAGLAIASADLRATTYLPFPREPGLLLDRSLLDQALRSHALALGVEILPQLAATSPWFEGTQLAGVTARGPGEREEIISCKALIDASGRGAFLARRLGWGFPYPRHRRAAAWGVYSGVSLPDWAPPGRMTTFVLPQGFLWLTPLADGTVGVGTTLPRSVWEEVGGSPERLLGKALGACPTVDWLLAKAVADHPVDATASLAFRVLDVAGHGFCIVGDAAGFIDPVVPHGLLAALLTGHSAGLDVAEALLHRGRVTAVDFGPTVSLVRLLHRQQLAHAHALYDRDFLAVLLAGCELWGGRQALQQLLAGDVLPPRRWRKLARAWMLVALAGVQEFTRRLGKPLYPLV